MNTLRTIVLMGFLTALIVAVGGVMGGRFGVLVAFVFAVLINFGSYWFSDKLALAMAHAQPVEPSQAPELYEIVQQLSEKAQIPRPAVYITPSASPNAFATGRDPEHSAIAVTQGILSILNTSELSAVLAHELAHVANRDVLITSIASVMASVVTMIAHFGMYGGRGEGDDRPNPVFALVLMIAAPIAASLINLAISRSREFEADRTGAQICGHPEALASALAKLEEGTQIRPMTGVNPAMGNMFTVRPDVGNWFVNLMSTHPPIEERIKRLLSMPRHDL